MKINILSFIIAALSLVVTAGILTVSIISILWRYVDKIIENQPVIRENEEYKKRIEKLEKEIQTKQAKQTKQEINTIPKALITSIAKPSQEKIVGRKLELNGEGIKMEGETESKVSKIDTEELNFQLEIEIKQFKFNSIAKQSPGIKRSITTAAFLSFLLPIIIILTLTSVSNPIILRPVELKIQILNKKQSSLIITNKSDSTITSMIINCVYGRSLLTNYKTNIPENIYANVSLLGKRNFSEGDNGNKNNKESPFRSSFKVDNLEENASIKIDLEFYSSSEGFDIKEVVGERVKLVKDENKMFSFLGIFSLNQLLFWLFCFLLVLIIIVYQSYAYIKTLLVAGNLENCLKFIIYDYGIESKTALKERSIADLYKHWEDIRKENSNAPKELGYFYEFVSQNNTIMERGQNMIWFAPFDLLGSPTFTKFFARNKCAVVIQLDKSGKVANIVAFDIISQLGVF